MSAGVTHLSFTAKKRVPLSGCHVPPALSYRTSRTSRTSRTAQKTPGIRQGGLLPPADPEGAQPWRDHRCLARWSRHEVPKTPGKTTSGMISDPARVSHLPVRQSVRHPGGVAGIEPHRNPESSGLRPSTSGLKNGHPCRGASSSTLHNELNSFCTAQMRHPCHYLCYLYYVVIFVTA